MLTIHAELISIQDMDCIQYTSEEALAEGHRRDLLDLNEACKQLKKTKGKSRTEIEAQIIQMEFDIRAKHREEEDLLQVYLSEQGEEALPPLAKVDSSPMDHDEENRKTQALIEAKKKKARNKRDKKLHKETTKEMLRASMAESAGESARETELTRIQGHLAENRLTIKEIASDGHCLYRYVSHYTWFSNV